MNLEQQVYKKLTEIPKGNVTTYGELAKAVGLKNGQRVIGQLKLIRKNGVLKLESLQLLRYC